MRRPSGSWFLGMLSLYSVLCSSCATERSVPGVHVQEAERTYRPHIEELGQFVLVLRETPGGRVTHEWTPAGSFDFSLYKHRPRYRPMGEGFMPVVARPRDCDEENRTCVAECMSTPLPRGFGHITAGGRGMGGKKAYCERRCMQPYTDCNESQGRQVQEFTSVDQAFPELKRNRPLILVGSVVVIAGTIFVAASAGAGLVILVPLAFVTAS